MAAVTEVRVHHGAGPTASAWAAGGRLHRADTTPTTDGATVYTPIPAAGTNYSWRKWAKLVVTSAPTGSISNLRWFYDGVALATGATLYVKKEATYTQASATDESASMTGYVDATTYTSGSPLTITAGTVLTATTGTGTQDYLVHQAAATSTTPAGTTAARTATYRWDET